MVARSRLEAIAAIDETIEAVLLDWEGLNETKRRAEGSEADDLLDVLAGAFPDVPVLVSTDHPDQVKPPRELKVEIHSSSDDVLSKVRDAVEARGLGDAAQPAVSPSERKPVVLVVEDDDNHWFLAKKALVKKGYRVLWAQDGKEGLAIVKAARERIDIVLTDFEMPNMDGFEMTKELLAIAPNLPVVMNTNAVSNKQAQRMSTLGVSRGSLANLKDLFQKNESIARPRDWTDHVDRVLAEQRRNVGGINLDAKGIDLKIQRGSKELSPFSSSSNESFQLPLNPEDLQGLVPIIIKITPITTPLLLGEKEEVAPRKELSAAY
ncbi:MAG: response regulator [Candidatus Omnitrophica bacterium]|nr:response regulator [Candidatus Omnitrophota bacterium]